MYLGLHSILNTTVLEPLAWTLMAYAAARAALRDEPRWWIAFGVILGVALEAKYAAPFFVALLLGGLLVSAQRRALFCASAAFGVALAVVIALPSFVWQAAHHFPFVELMHAASTGKNTVIAPGAFLLNQLLVMNPVVALLALGGVAWALVSPGLVRVRFLALGYLGVLVEMMLLHGKDYYVAPAYGVAFALGAVAAARVLRSIAARMIFYCRRRRSRSSLCRRP